MAAAVVDAAERVYVLHACCCSVENLPKNINIFYYYYNPTFSWERKKKLFTKACFPWEHNNTACRMSTFMHTLGHVLACLFLVEGNVKQELVYWL